MNPIKFSKETEEFVDQLQQCEPVIGYTKPTLSDSTRCLVVLDANNNVRALFISNEERDCGLHNMGISPEKYKELGWKAVVGEVRYNKENAI